MRDRVYLLRGLLRCGLCGHALVGHTRTKVPKKWGYREHRYYECWMRRAQPPEARCTSKALLVVGVDEAVWMAVRDLLLDDDALVEQLKAWLNRTTSDPSGDDRLSLATSRLTELDRQKTRLTDAYQTGALELKDFQSRKLAIEERIVAVEQELAEMRSWASKRELAMRQVVSAQAIVEQLRAQLAAPDFDTKQAIIRLVVEKIVVTGYRLEIHLGLPVSGSSCLTFTWGATDSQPRAIVVDMDEARPSDGRGFVACRVGRTISPIIRPVAATVTASS